MVLAFLFAFALFLGCAFLYAPSKRRKRANALASAVESALPGYDCGFCGKSDCGEYAKAIADEGEVIGLCSPGGPATETALGGLIGEGDPRKTGKWAVVRCGARGKVAKTHFTYEGAADCVSATALYGGPLRCKQGCVGLGNCVKSCPAGAIRMLEAVAIVSPELCNGCGRCISSCPLSLIALIPIDREWYVACNNQNEAEDKKSICPAACTACGDCVRRSLSGEFSIIRGLAYAAGSSTRLNEGIAAACPTGAILRAGHEKRGKPSSDGKGPGV